MNKWKGPFFPGEEQIKRTFFTPEEQIKWTVFFLRGTNQTDLFYSEWNKSNGPIFSAREQIKWTFLISRGTNKMDLFLKKWKLKLKLSRDYESHVTSYSFCKDHFRCSFRWNRNWKYLDTQLYKKANFSKITF